MNQLAVSNRNTVWRAFFRFCTGGRRQPAYAEKRPDRGIDGALVAIPQSSPTRNCPGYSPTTVTHYTRDRRRAFGSSLLLATGPVAMTSLLTAPASSLAAYERSSFMPLSS
jgi:hypothetical protein